jgi:UDP-glucose 4-epimerase
MKNKDVLVTGGAGFIGSHLVKRLLNDGANVSVTVKYNSIIDNVRLASVWDAISILEADLRNIDSVFQLRNLEFDYIFHLAAYNHVGDSFKHVNEAINSNTIATANLLEYGPSYKSFLYMSTSEVYGYQTIIPFNEDSTPFPISPYAVGKYGGELYAQMKKHQTNNTIVCVRAFNTFGPFQSEKAVIPELISKALKGVPIETTKGLQTREFNYVVNVVDGLIAAITKSPSFEGVINIGANDDISIANLVRLIHRLSNSKSELRIGALTDRPTEIWEMSANNDKAQEILNWKPKILFEEGLLNTIEWFKKYVQIFYDKNSDLLNISN